MRLQVFLIMAAVTVASQCSSAAFADTYSRVTTTEESQPVTEVQQYTTTTQELQPLTEVRQIRTIESVPSTTVIRELPVLINQPVDREVVIVKRHHHHLINVGPVKVF
jgi:hypothetical protein